MFICTECWNESLKWQWQCSFCKEWNTLKEFKEEKTKSSTKKWEAKQLKKLENVELKWEKILTKSEELNNVLGNWITKWSVILLSWEPWVGKSTLALQLTNWIDEDLVYISWEETEFQIFDRGRRLQINSKNLFVLSENSLENILETIRANSQKIIIIDSISVIFSENSTWVSWSVSQVRYICEKLVDLAKKNNTTIIIIGHITKDWSLAGPKTLEHMVDTVLYFSWDKFDNIRILRSLKNRFGSTSEVWIFKMSETWLSDLKNPWLEFISSKENSIWASLSITMEWTRPIVIETESLTTYTKFGYPKRSSRWLNSSKLDLIIAVLGKYTKVSLESYDVYSNIVRWFKIEEPWIDLSLAVSIISSKLNKVISKESIFIWEISLTWKIKNVMFLEKRIKEAEKMWFKKIFVPKTHPQPINSNHPQPFLPKEGSSKRNIEIIEISDVKELVEKV